MIKLNKRNIFAGLFLLFNWHTAAYAELPNLGSSNSGIFSVIQEKALGEQFINYVKRVYYINDDPLLVDYINSLGFNLVARSPTPAKHFDFFIVNDSQINAFAGPYGYVGINSGLFLASRSESELAAVVAHEVAHVTQRHIMRGIENIQRTQALAIPAIIAGMIIGAADANVGSGIAAAGIGGAQQNIINFTRSHEQEADRIGIQILYDAGFDPSGMVTFFYRLQEQSRLMGSNLPEFLRTHPVTENRIADAANRVEQYPERLHQDSLTYAMLKQRLRVLTTTNTQNLIPRYEAELENEQSLAMNYGYALALTKSNRTQQALELLQSLVEQYPYNSIIQLGLVEVHTAMGNYDDALIILENLYTLYPDSYPVILEYVRILDITNTTESLINLLTTAIGYYPNRAELYALLAQAYADAGQQALAYYQRAQQFQLDGNLELAIVQLQLALQQADLTTSLEAQINRLLADWQEKVNK